MLPRIADWSVRSLGLPFGRVPGQPL